MCHRNFCRFKDGQDLIENFADENEILGDITYILPNLKGIGYSYQKKDMDHTLQAPNLASLSRIAHINKSACVANFCL